ncbi:MAG: DotA/TraY family protein [Alphaproteobacteria bacterium]|nr:DotA/TraY family protein [Alphaproteobacteria bacterium]
MISIRQASSFFFMPRVFPRFKSLAPDTGFFAELMALVFYNVGLFPRGHRFLLPTFQGQLDVRSVMAEAAANLKGGWRHSDQYAVYVTFVLAMILFLIQFLALFVMVLSQSAQAAAPFLSMFITSDPTDDVAFMMLDKVFQVPGFFGSIFDPVTSAGIGGFALGMQALFRFYSYGMLVIALFIIIYYIFALMAETAQTGVPFGKRFPSIYGPIRLILAVLLLLPLSYGYNTGQYFTLFMAKWGSSLATNGWLAFNEVISASAYNNPMGLSPQEMVGKPKIQPVSSLINFFYLVHTCKAGYKIAYGAQKADIQPYFVIPANGTSPASATLMTSSSAYPTVLNMFHGGDIVITFGEKDSKYVKEIAGVKPYCGQLTIPINSKDVTMVTDVYDAYFKYVATLWNNNDLRIYGENMAYILRFMDKIPASYTFSGPSVGWGAPLSSTELNPAGADFYRDMRTNLQAAFNASIDAAIVNMRTTTIADLEMQTEVLDRGWGGAGIWYNRIADFNGAMVDAVFTIPTPTAYPMVMEHVASVKKSLESSSNPKERFSVGTVNGKNMTMDKFSSGSNLDNPAIDVEMARLLSTVYETVSDDSVTARPKPGTVANDPIRNMFMFIFQESGLMDVRGNDGVFPLSKLAMLGKTIINKTIVSLGVGTLVSGFGGLLSGAGSEELGAAFEEGGSVLLSFATMGLIIGFVLYYLIPFFPFMYFFFAVSRWVKSIFEAMVAVPLWALAHLRLDGEGVGNAASKGYFLLLEIMLRPIFTVFGLLAAVITFSALVSVLDTIFDLVVVNVAGFDLTTLSSTSPTPAGDFMQSFRDSLDAFFYTVLYTIILYMMAMASFKLIDLIPNKLLRFLQPVPTFHDDASDPAENLVRNTAFAGHHLTGEIGKGLGGFAKGVGQSAGKAISSGTADKMAGPGS